MEIRRGARALLLDREDRLLLIRRLKGGHEYFPTVGGGIDPGDRTPEDAMRREVFEEVGGVVGPAQLVFLSTSPLDGVVGGALGMQYIFLARLLAMDYAARTDPPVPDGERHEPHWTTWDELGDLDLRPTELKDYMLTNALVLREIAGTL